jgi:2,3-bisphosphoglycerate-independent phosphoglycerate mutase
MDHLTPVAKRSHVSDPAPFLLVEDLNGGARSGQSPAAFSEREALKAGLNLPGGDRLFDLLVGTPS